MREYMSMTFPAVKVSAVCEANFDTVTSAGLLSKPSGWPPPTEAFRNAR